MKEWIYSTAAKAAGVVLLVINIVLFTAGCLGVAVMSQYGFYDQSMGTIRQKLFNSITTSYNYQVHSYYNDGDMEIDIANNFKGTGYYFQLKDSEGKVILTNYNGEKTQYSKDTTFSYDDDKNGKIIEYTITGYVAEYIGQTDRYGRVDYWMTKAYNMKYFVIALDILTGIIIIALFIYLMCIAGYKAKGEKPEPGFLEKLPFDVYTALMLLLIVLEIASNPEGNPAVLIILGIVDVAMLVIYLMSFAVRIRTVGIIKRTFIYMVLGFIFSHLAYLLKNLSLVWKTALAVLVLSLVELIGFPDHGRYLWFIEKLILVPSILYIAIALRKLQMGGEAIAEGDLSSKVDTSRMLWDFKRHGENLNSISQGMSKAVDERMKSERLKTELITNVSHDIKTPLTSIINYVDLIKKEDIENDTIKGYVQVLDRQSTRLKKLIEDLVEASKASTGNIKVDMTPCQIGVMLNQLQGEYQDKLKAAELELIIKQPEEPISIMADGRHMWRVMDNLMNNICKYAQPSTRVYITLEAREDKAVITFKNVSRFELGISPEELMERFVRGDVSRNTEGSGLGLSIAKSLTELQKGKLELSIDGDLFKAQISFNML